MDIMDNIKTGINLVAETAAELAKSAAEKNRLRVQLNHMKKFIKAQSATRDQAYMELGRFFYDNLREGASPENEALCTVIDDTTVAISKASMKYMELLNLQNETKIRSDNTDKLKKVVSEKAAEAAEKAKSAAEVGAKKAKDFAADTAQKAKEFKNRAAEGAEDFKDRAGATVEDLKDRAVDAVEDIKENFSSDSDIEQLIKEEQEKMQQAAAEATEAAEEPAPKPAEESPEDFDF